MPESDVTKMKVADLKRELKLRGLAHTGNKTELQDRLQTALIDGDMSLEDTAISGEDALLDDDTVLTDEDEAKILGADENELLKSPTTISTAPDLTSPVSGVAGITINSTDVLPSPTASKKIVLKRKNSFTLTASSATAITTTAKENAEPTTAKTIKMSERNPITAFGGSSDNANTATAAAVEKSSDAGTTSKISQLTTQERMELRAKKFGIKASTTPTVAADGTITAAAPADDGDEKQIEMLKKRAERFGCVVSSKIAKIDAEEKLLKRKQRFGGGAEGTDAAAGATDTTGTSSVWAEKARLRLARFKNNTSSAAAAEPTAIPASTAAVASTTEI